MEIKIEIIKIINEIKAIFKNEVKKVQKKIPQNIIKGFLRDIAFSLKARLPQIYRFIPAKYFVLVLKTIFWAIVFGFLIYNFLPLPYFNLWVINNTAEEHIRLAGEFLKTNNYREAEKEYQLAKSKIKNQKSKIIDKKINDIRGKIEEVERLEKETTRWERILRERPNYRDAYLKLATLHYQMERPLTAKDYLNKAKELDPNFPLVKELEMIFQKE